MGLPFDFNYVFWFIPKLVTTLALTLMIVAGSLASGFVFGLIAALPRLYNFPLLRQTSAAYASFFRGTPILIQLFLIYYGLPELLKWISIDITRAPALLFVILAYGLHTGAYVSETIRAAVTAVDRGQVEAAYALGMTGPQAFRRIVVPQALAIAVPVFANQTLALLKDTSLAFSLGVMEMSGKAQSLARVTQHFLEAYLALALIYLAVAFILEKLLLAAERRLLRFEHPDAAHGRFRLHKGLTLRKLASGLSGGSSS